MLLCQRREAGQEGEGARGREARGEDRCYEGMLRVERLDVVYCRLGRGQGGRRGRVAVVCRLRLGAVHGAAADEGALSGGEGEAGEEVGRFRGYHRVVGCCCRAVGEGAGDAARVDAAGFGEGGEGGFEREGVG